MQNSLAGTVTCLAPLHFPDEEVLERISYRLKLAADSAVGRHMVMTLKQADQIAFDYWHDYVAHLPAWEASRLMLKNVVFPPQCGPRTVEEMLANLLSIAIRLGVTWPGMTREQLEEKNEYRRLLNEAVELIEPSARKFDRIGRNIARAIESFGVCLDDVKSPQAHDELTIVMGLLDNLCREGVNTHEDVLGVSQNFIVSHLGRLSIHENISVNNASLQRQLQESLATNRRITDDLNAARSLINTQNTWKQQESAAQTMIAHLEKSVRSLEAQLAKMREQSVASVHDTVLRELHEDHLSILREIAFLRAQRMRITQEMANAQKDHTIALEHGHHNTMNKRLDAVINAAKRIQEIGDTIPHLEKVRQGIEKNMEDRTRELQSELLGERYFDTEHPAQNTGGNANHAENGTMGNGESIWNLIDEFPAPNVLLNITNPRLKWMLGRLRGELALCSLSEFLQQIGSGAIQRSMDAWQSDRLIRKPGRATLEEVIEHVRTLPLFAPDGSLDEKKLVAYYQEVVTAAKTPFIVGRLRTHEEEPKDEEKESLIQRVSRSVSLFVSARFRPTFDEIIKAKAVDSLWSLLEAMPHRSSFRRQVKQSYKQIWMSRFDGLCLRLLRLDLWNQYKSALDHAKVDAFLSAQGF